LVNLRELCGGESGTAAGLLPGNFSLSCHHSNHYRIPSHHGLVQCTNLWPHYWGAHSYLRLTYVMRKEAFQVIMSLA